MAFTVNNYIEDTCDKCGKEKATNAQFQVRTRHEFASITVCVRCLEKIVKKLQYMVEHSVVVE